MVGDIARVRDANVRPGLEDAVLAAADECPVGCIHVE